MSKFSKKIKTIFTFIALLFAGVLFAVNPISHKLANYSAVDAASELTGTNTLKVSNISQTKVNLKDGALLIPFASSNISEYTIRLLDGSGKIHDYNVVKGTNDKIAPGTIADEKKSAQQDEFEVVRVLDGKVVTDEMMAEDPTTYPADAAYKPFLTIKSKASNKYRLMYIYKNGNNVYYTNTYDLEVVGQDYTIDFRNVEGASGTATISRTEQLFPSQEKTGNSLTINPVYAHPTLEKGEEDNVEDWVELTPTFYFGGNKVVDGKITVDGTDYTVLTKNETTGVYTLTFKKAGKYRVEYSYLDANNAPSVSKSIEVKDEFVAPTEADITISSVSLPSNVELGDKNVSLPRPTLAYSSEYKNNNVAYNVEKVIIEKELSNIKIELEKNQLTFDFTTEFFSAKLGRTVSYEELTGVYNVTYVMKDLFGTTLTRTYKWGTISISSKPNIYAVYDYTAFDGDNYVAELDKLDTTVSTEIRGKYGYQEIILPAVYAYDKISNYDDLLVYRYIERKDGSGQRIYLDNVMISTSGETYSYSNVSSQSNKNKAFDGSFDFSTPEGRKAYYQRLSSSIQLKLWADDADVNSDLIGDYTLYYRVYCKNKIADSANTHRNNYLYTETGSYYTFEVVNSAFAVNTSSELKVKLEGVANNDQVVEGDELSLKVTATDNDTRLNTALYYYTSTTSSNSFETDLLSAINTALASESSNHVGQAENEDNATKEVYLLGKSSVLKTQALIDAMTALNYTNFGIVNEETETGYKIDFSKSFIESLGITGAGNVNVVAVALNDYREVKATAPKTIVVANSKESASPYVTKVTAKNKNDDGTTDSVNWWANGQTFAQNREIFLPDITFEDAVDNDLSTNIRYYVIPKNELTDEISAHNYYANPFMYPEDSDCVGNKIVGGRITTSAVGRYVIVYTATDDAGNTNVTTYYFDVESTAKPILTVVPTGSDFTLSGGKTISCEVGAQIGLDITVIDPNTGEDITEDTAKCTITKSAPGADRVNKKYQFNRYGDFTITVTANCKVGSGASETPYTLTQTYTVSVKKPELKWVNENDTICPPTASTNTLVELGALKAEEGTNNVNVNVTVKNGSDQPVEVTYNSSKNKWEFTTGKKGKYTVTYTATSASGKEKTNNYTIQVGDDQAPEFKVNNDALLTNEVAYNETEIEYVVKLSTSNRILIIEAKQGEEVLYTWTSYQDYANRKTDHSNLKIFENDDNGKTSSDFKWSNLKITLTSSDNIVTEEGTEEETVDEITYSVTTYKITGTGKCTLNLSCTDDAQNTGTKAFSFIVSTTADVSEEKDNSAGIVLLVVSIVVLLGVVMFFIFTGKNGGKTVVRKPAKELPETTEESDNNE